MQLMNKKLRALDIVLLNKQTKKYNDERTSSLYTKLHYNLFEMMKTSAFVLLKKILLTI